MTYKMIALLTDFGADNHYVAQMKGRIYRENPDVQVVDITHSIRPQNVVEGAYILRDSVDAFATGTVFVAVVDPGVGTSRKILIAQTNEKLFVLPDNGLIEIVSQYYSLDKIIEVEQGNFSASATFHGRDIMAPVAARISLGDMPEKWGRPIQGDVCRLGFDGVTQHELPDGRRQIKGQFVYTDCFGNAISNIDRELLPEDFSRVRVQFGQSNLNSIRKTFADVSQGEVLALIGSHERVEIAINQGNAEKSLGIEQLDQVVVEWSF